MNRSMANNRHIIQSIIRSTLFLAVFFPLLLSAQSGRPMEAKKFRFFVEFRDKSTSAFSILRPNEFLSEKAILRRKKAGIPIDMADLPVTKSNLTALIAAGAEILNTSKWLNAVLIQTSDSSVAAKLATYTTVKSVTYLGVLQKKRGAIALNPEAFDDHGVEESMAEERILVKNRNNGTKSTSIYGDGWDQIRQLNGHKLHSAGFRGKGVLVAVLDAGFYRANQMQIFDSLFRRGGVVATRDFTNNDALVYDDDDHGTQVLSCMAANLPNVFIGTAPDADFLLLRTEEANAENLWEEATWATAAEYADSMGADIINSSLGYTLFDQAGTSHNYKDLDGETTIITRAANMAWSRGILVINSAGNEGDGPWQYIGAPADAAGVIAVGAVDRNGKRAMFSSIGPTADGRCKPDLCAMGKSATVASPSGYIRKINGTSFSSPVLAGMFACAVQRFPGFTPVEIRKLVSLAASGFTDANDKTGKGIPDFQQFIQIGEAKSAVNSSTGPAFIAWVPADTTSTAFAVKTIKQPKIGWFYTLTTEKGKIMSSGKLFYHEQLVYGTVIEPVKTGSYTLTIYDGKEKSTEKQFYFVAKSSDDEYE